MVEQGECTARKIKMALRGLESSLVFNQNDPYLWAFLKRGFVKLERKHPESSYYYDFYSLTPKGRDCFMGAGK